MYLYRTALESHIYTCTEQLRSQEYNLHVQLWSQLYISVQNSSGVLYIPLQNSFGVLYIPVLNSSGVWSPIYLYRTALESPEFTIQVLSNMKKAIRAVDPPVILYEPWTKYRLPTFIPSICSFSCLFVWIVTCTLYNHTKLNVSHCRWQGKIYAFHGLSKSYKHVHCP